MTSVRPIKEEMRDATETLDTDIKENRDFLEDSNGFVHTLADMVRWFQRMYGEKRWLFGFTLIVVVSSFILTSLQYYVLIFIWAELNLIDNHDRFCMPSNHQAFVQVAALSFLLFHMYSDTLNTTENRKKRKHFRWKFSLWYFPTDLLSVMMDLLPFAVGIVGTHLILKSSDSIAMISNALALTFVYNLDDILFERLNARLSKDFFNKCPRCMLHDITDEIGAPIINDRLLEICWTKDGDQLIPKMNKELFSRDEFGDGAFSKAEEGVFFTEDYGA